MSTANKKAALLLAAKTLFGEYGYVETTFKKISDHAGVALGLLTHHYGNKEKLFFAAGMDVLERLLATLRAATARGKNGFEASVFFCQAYLDFSTDPDAHWNVLVRCSPYSDVKSDEDREQLTAQFNQVHEELARQLRRGIADGSIRALDIKETTQIIISTMSGVNRTNMLTPYASKGLYPETLRFISRAIQS